MEVNLPTCSLFLSFFAQTYLDPSPGLVGQIIHWRCSTRLDGAPQEEVQLYRVYFIIHPQNLEARRDMLRTNIFPCANIHTDKLTDLTADKSFSPSYLEDELGDEHELVTLK